MSPEWIIAYLALGAVVGVMAGMLGIGGGGIIVPILTTIFAAQGIPDEQIVHLSLGTAMATIVITATSSIRAHHRHGAVLWPVVWKMAPGVLVGTFCATYLASHLSSRALGIFFACFMGYVALGMFRNLKPKPQRQLPAPPVCALVGAVIGGISALAAIGGGALTTTFLMWCNTHVRQAIATSAAVGLPIAVAGTLGYIVNGLGTEGLPIHSAGFVYLPAVVLIATTSFFTAPIGAKLTHTLPGGVVKKTFAVLLIGLSVKMLFTVFGT
ncbi:sulfite exporter TauE/SafE family protein [Ruficoccus amylovorans]|uniref:Probable membrane transporter protein n=1 Tax=Ruficoccus amylovorans TaxID=1804625 RepID=A0A842HAR2_9BACT|nr:sulfite exporter TauE/SafE family protein [Ruficoccus amylovorans]MBC2593445.1 sulfite exporter TauE/SafE family protein [Ruficoccus amylovorans]